jgi:hypothetical protein
MSTKSVCRKETIVIAGLIITLLIPCITFAYKPIWLKNISLLWSVIGLQITSATTNPYTCEKHNEPGENAGETCETSLCQEDESTEEEIQNMSWQGNQNPPAPGPRGGSGGGGGCRSCKSTKATFVGTSPKIEETPFFFRVSAGPDLFIKYKYIKPAGTEEPESILGKNILTTHSNIKLELESEDNIKIHRGSDYLTLDYYQTEEVYMDESDICEATVPRDETTVTVTYKHSKTKQVYEENTTLGYYLLKTITSENGSVNEFEYDTTDEDRIVSVTEKVGGSTSYRKIIYTYYTSGDEVGLLQKCALVDGSNNDIYSATFEYYSTRRLKKSTDMEGNTTEYVWNGNKITEMKKNGKKIIEIDNTNNTIKRFIDPDLTNGPYIEETSKSKAYYEYDNGSYQKIEEYVTDIEYT